MNDSCDAAFMEAWHRLVDRCPESTQMSQPEWFRSVISSLPGAQPVMLSRTDGEELTTLVAGRIEKVLVPARIGYRQMLPVRLVTLQVMRGCILGSLAEPDALLADIMRAAADRGAHAVALPHLAIDHPLLLAVERVSRPWRRTTAPTQLRHRSSLPNGGYDELMKGSTSTRKRIRQYEKRLARDHEVVLDVYTGVDDLDAFLAEAEPIAKRSYQHALGAGLGAIGESERLRAIAALGWFRGYILRVDGAAWTYDYGFLHDTVYIASGTGYLIEHAKTRPGNIALARWVDELAEHGITEIDWGAGDADYKRSLSSGAVREKPTAVYRKTVPGTACAVAATAVDVVDRAARIGARRLGNIDALKSTERNRLRAGKWFRRRIGRSTAEN